MMMMQMQSPSRVPPHIMHFTIVGTWARNQLFLVTPSAVVLVFAAAGGGSGRIVGLGGTSEPFVEVGWQRTRKNLAGHSLRDVVTVLCSSLRRPLNN